MSKLSDRVGRFALGTWRCLAFAAIVFIVPLLLAPPNGASAQTPPPAPDQAGDQDQQPDPPARVGRLSYISGTVSFRTLDDDQWDTAVVNYPVTAGLGFWTEPNSRATLQLGHGAVRMESATELDVQQFDDQTIQIGVPQGSINFRLRSLAPGETYQIVTPTGTVRLNAPGRYDIAVSGDGSPARVTVFEGSADIIGENGASVTVTPGQVGSVAPTPPPPTPGAAQIAPIDSFSDQQEAAMAQVPNYVSPDIPGIQDVVSVGAWDNSPEYGRVWYPPVQVGWAPYRYGHWAFVAPWGWTWIDDAPWGFAPFHYGRWVEVGPRWAWVPGAVVPSPVYAPALVAFVGGPMLAVGFGVGPVVGWIPLGPREVYVPPYGGSMNYIRHVNVTNVTNVTVINRTTINNYRSQGADRFVNARGATVVRSNAMTNSSSIRNSSLQVDPARFRGVNAASNVPVRPNLGTKGVSPNIVKAAGGNASSGGEKKRSSPGPKGGTKVFTPASAGSKGGTGGLKTFTPPGGVKSFTPSAGGGGAGTGGAKSSGTGGAKTFTPSGSGTGTGTGASGSKGVTGTGAGGTGTGGSKSSGTGGVKTFTPSGSGVGTGGAGGSKGAGGAGTGGTGAGGSKSSGTGGVGGSKGGTGTGTGGTGVGGSKSSGAGGAKTFTPSGGAGSTGGSKGGTGTSTGGTGAGGSKSSSTGGAKTFTPSGSSSGAGSNGAGGAGTGGTGGSKSGGTGGAQSNGSKSTGGSAPNNSGNKSGSPPPCNPPHHIVNGKCV